MHNSDLSSACISCSEWPDTVRRWTPLFCICTLGFAIRKVQDNPEGLKVDGIHQHMVCAADVNLLVKIPNTNR
jgi:hypothetical protein